MSLDTPTYGEFVIVEEIFSTNILKNFCLCYPIFEVGFTISEIESDCDDYDNTFIKKRGGTVIVNKAYKIRIYPTKEQDVLINKTIGCCRFVLKPVFSSASHCLESKELLSHSGTCNCNEPVPGRGFSGCVCLYPHRKLSPCASASDRTEQFKGSKT
ncbi:Transposase [Paenibacillus larvae]